MRQAHGPYRHGNRWRIVVTEIDGRQTAFSFASREEAEIDLRAKHAAMAVGAQAELVAAMSTPLPEDPAWIYFLHDEAGTVVYVGVSGNLGGRIEEHRGGKEFVRASYLPTAMPRASALQVEIQLVRLLRPRLNQNLLGNSAVPRVSNGAAD